MQPNERSGAERTRGMTEAHHHPRELLQQDREFTIAKDGVSFPRTRQPAKPGG